MKSEIIVIFCFQELSSIHSLLAGNSYSSKAKQSGGFPWWAGCFIGVFIFCCLCGAGRNKGGRKPSAAAPAPTPAPARDPAPASVPATRSPSNPSGDEPAATNAPLTETSAAAVGREGQTSMIANGGETRTSSNNMETVSVLPISSTPYQGIVVAFYQRWLIELRSCIITVEKLLIFDNLSDKQHDLYKAVNHIPQSH